MWDARSSPEPIERASRAPGRRLVRMIRSGQPGVRTLASSAGIVLRPRRVMSSSASEARDTAGGRLGGARADFVASLGRKLNDARDLLNALEEDPSSKVARDELRRRLHALGSGARLLRF